MPTTASRPSSRSSRRTGREEIAKRIESAREEGDLKENGGYHAAKDEQGKQEARIRTLSTCCKTATVGEAPAEHRRRRARHRVTAIVAGDEEIFLLGNREIAVDSELDVYSEASPARRGDPRPEGGREDHLHRAQRPRDRRRGHRRSRPTTGSDATGRRAGGRISPGRRSGRSPLRRAISITCARCSSPARLDAQLQDRPR